MSAGAAARDHLLPLQAPAVGALLGSHPPVRHVGRGRPGRCGAGGRLLRRLGPGRLPLRAPRRLHPARRTDRARRGLRRHRHRLRASDPRGPVQGVVRHRRGATGGRRAQRRPAPVAVQRATHGGEGGAVRPAVARPHGRCAGRDLEQPQRGPGARAVRRAPRARPGRTGVDLLPVLLRPRRHRRSLRARPAGPARRREHSPVGAPVVGREPARLQRRPLRVLHPLGGAGARTTFGRLARPYLCPEAATEGDPKPQERLDGGVWHYFSLDEPSGYGVAADRCRDALESSGVEVEWTPFVPGGGWGLGYQPPPWHDPFAARGHRWVPPTADPRATPRGPRRPGRRRPPGARVLPGRPRAPPRRLRGRAHGLGDGPDPRPLDRLPRRGGPGRRPVPVQRGGDHVVGGQDAGGRGPARRPETGARDRRRRAGPTPRRRSSSTPSPNGTNGRPRS